MDFMDLALVEAKKAYDIGEVPVGAVIVKNGEVIAKSYNMKETMKLSTAHAEMLAIEEASRVIGDWRLNGCDMYVTLEPCAMCASAIANSRISKLYIGTFNIDMGACGTILNILDYNIFNHKINTIWCYDKACSDMLTEFFNTRRKNNK